MNQKEQNGILIIISSHSGGGKGTITKEIFKKFKKIKPSVSMTTREKRSGETEGKDYYFVSKEDFEKHIKKGDILEYAMLHRFFYSGTPRKPIEAALKKGQSILLEIDVQGLKSIKKLFPKKQILSIFIKTPTLEEARRRLLLRGRDTVDEIEERMLTAEEELKHVNEYDYLIINDDLQTALNEIFEIIEKKIQ